VDSGRSSQADPEDVARLAVQRGAQDYLLQDRIDGYSLPKALTGMLERSAFAEALFLEKERAQVTLNSIGDAVISIDVAGHVTYLNPVAESMTGWLRQEASGRPLQDVLRIIDGETREPALNPLAMAMLHNKSVSLSANCSGRRRRHFKAQGTSLSRPDRPNDLWCADYKGEFMLADRRYCYPLTVTDFATRYLLCCEALETTKERYAFTVFVLSGT
jgi:PAS domain-containing protein